VGVVGRLGRPIRMTVGVPWPGMKAPDVSITSSRSTGLSRVLLTSFPARNTSITFLPNSRFMKLLLVIWPT